MGKVPGRVESEGPEEMAGEGTQRTDERWHFYEEQSRVLAVEIPGECGVDRTG